MTVIRKSDRLVNLGSAKLGEPDDSPDDESSEDGMTSQDDFLNTGGRNGKRPDDPHDSSSEDEVYVVPLRRSPRRKRPDPGCNLCDHGLGLGWNLAKGKMSYLVILSDPVRVLLTDVQ